MMGRVFFMCSLLAHSLKAASSHSTLLITVKYLSKSPSHYAQAGLPTNGQTGKMDLTVMVNGDR